jgi:hypothetical protein
VERGDGRGGGRGEELGEDAALEAPPVLLLFKILDIITFVF